MREYRLYFVTKKLNSIRGESKPGPSGIGFIADSSHAYQKMAAFAGRKVLNGLRKIQGMALEQEADVGSSGYRFFATGNIML